MCTAEDAEKILYILKFTVYSRNSVHLVIRKVQFAPETPGPQPMVETRRSYLMSDRSLHLEASLDKEVTHTLIYCRLERTQQSKCVTLVLAVLPRRAH